MVTTEMRCFSIVVLLLTLVGCGSEPEPPEQEEQSQVELPTSPEQSDIVDEEKDGSKSTTEEPAVDASPTVDETESNEAVPIANAPFDAKQALEYQEAWARRLSSQVEVTNTIGMTLRLIPPGEFLMGSSEDEEHRGNDESQHRVRLSKSFFISICEVTQGQYESEMEKNSSSYSSNGTDERAVGPDTSQFPVESVNWFDAVEFCNKLSEKEVLPVYYRRDGNDVEFSGGNGYRLPTEAEWEYACRAGAMTAWHCGHSAEDLPQYAWFSTRTTHPVGQLKPNAFGLHDMHGNVYEWCQDWHGPYGNEELAVDPAGLDEGRSRVLRSGSFSGDAGSVRSARRRGVYRPDVRKPNVGIRVARDCCALISCGHREWIEH